MTCWRWRSYNKCEHSRGRYTRSSVAGSTNSVYQRALAHALYRAGLRYEAQRRVDVRYEDAIVGTAVLDFLVEDEVVVQVKAVAGIQNLAVSQANAYMRITGNSHGLVINFHPNGQGLESRVLGSD